MPLARSPHRIPEDKSTRLEWLMAFVDGQMPEDSTLDYKAGDALNKSSTDHYNRRRPHQALGNRTPADCYGKASGSGQAGRRAVTRESAA